MRRRDFVSLGGIVGLSLLGGCTGDGDEPVEDQVDGGATTTSTPTAESTATETPRETERETETEAETRSSGEAEIALQDHELVVEEGEFSTNVYVVATVENTGNAPSGSIELTARWYDEDGNYLDNDIEMLQSLGQDETWAARVFYLGSDAGNVADYELEGEFDREPPATDPDGLELVESELNVGEDSALVTGKVQNTRDETVSYVQATTKLYDQDGVVLRDEYTNVTDLPAGETWSFESETLGYARVDRISDHSVWITASVY